jgi:hypothetical protein
VHGARRPRRLLQHEGDLQVDAVLGDTTVLDAHHLLLPPRPADAADDSPAFAMLWRTASSKPSADVAENSIALATLIALLPSIWIE